MLYSVLFLTVTSGCKLVDEYQDVEYDKEYYLVQSEALEHFDTHMNNSIIFNKDGTYIRTEDGFIDAWKIPEFNEAFFIQIDRITGSWKYEDGILLLTDHSIDVFRCLDSNGVELECHGVDVMQSLGMHEKFIDRRVQESEGEKLII